MSEKSAAPSATLPASSPLAIVGLGCLFPKAGDVGAYWANIRQGIDAISEVPESHWRTQDYFDADPKSPDKVYARHGGFLSPVDFNPLEYGILPNALEATDTSQLLGLVAVDQALKDAGYGPEREFDRERVSVILGVTGTLELVIPLGARLGHPRWRAALQEAGVEEAVAEDVVGRIADSYVPWQENSFPGLLGNVVAGRISRHFNFSGTNCVCDAACGSSLSAVNLAALELAAGKADMVVTGGIDTFNDIFMYTCFSKTPALSPSGHARPFAADGDGTTLGEGLGIVVLKRLADAERDGDRIYAVIRGIGTSSDGRGAAIYEPNAAGQQKALRRAYEQAGVSPDTIELIEAHGTGTKVGDAIEVKALRAVFGEADEPYCAIGSVKSQVGHTKAAAGAAGLIKATMALYHKVLPPTIKVKQPQEAVTAGRTPFYVNTEARPWLPRGDHPRRAGVSALGFGGSNFHCLLEEYQPEKPAGDGEADIQIAAFTGADRGAIRAALNAFPAQGSWPEVRLAAHRSRKAFAAEHPCRLLLVIERERNLAAQLQSARALLEKGTDEGFWSSPDGIFFAAGAPATGLAMLFPGQGAQYPGMLRDLALHFPEFFAVLQEADAAFAANSGPGQSRLANLVHPRPAFDAEQRQANERCLQATEVAQPALGAVSLGALEVLASFGLRAEAYAGHSYGELTALCAAGRFDRPALHALSRLRGELMAAGAGDRGSMLAVSAPLAQIEALLAEEGLQLVLANRNTPQQGVLSGATAEIERAAEILGRRGIGCKQLSVAAAFHSELVAEASGPFGARLQEIPFAAGTAPVFANTTGQAYPADAQAARQLLAEQLARPVAFVAEIDVLYGSGIRTFLEVGPGARLTGMVKSILAERPHQALAIDASAGKRSGLLDLARTLAHLAALGHRLELARWDADAATLESRMDKKKPGMVVPICGANHFQAPPKRPAVTPKAAPVAAAPAQPAAAAAPAGAMPVPMPGGQLPSGNLQDALRLTQQSLQALQSLQEQTAQLHQKFLEGQELAGRTMLSLIEQQRLLFQGGTLPSLVAAPVVAPLRPAVESPAVQAPMTAAASAAPAPVAPVVAVSTPAAPAPASARIAEVLLLVIAEKTGYPVEMLELDMALDADLGIDSIKRVEILSALQEQLPEAPPIRPEHLGSLHTLGQIVAHLGAGQPAAAAPVAAPALAGARIAEVLLAVIADKTGYPVEMLELDMALDADLGIDSIKRVEILSALQEQLPEAPAIRPEHLGSLHTLGQIVAHLGAGTAASEAPPAPVTLSATRIADVLLAVIADKTGYPVEMLALDMALDADLGIDSIKRVEILSALQEQLPEAPAVRPEHLGSLHTLGQIVDFLAAGNRPQPSAAVATAAGGPLQYETVAGTLLAVIADKTGYPVEMLELDMALDADLGIDSIKRVEILSALQEQLPGAPAIRPEHLGTLQTVRQIVDFLASVSGATASAAPVTDSSDPQPVAAGIERKVLKAVPLSGRGERPRLELGAGATIWISDDGSALAKELAAALAGRQFQPLLVDAASALQRPAQLAGLILLAPAQGTNDAFLQQAFALLQLAGPALRAAGDGAASLLASVSRLDGSFGLLPGGEPLDPLSGGLAGLVKTASLEWPQVHCKAIDLAADLGGAAAEELVAELLADGPLEVGLSSRGRHTLKLSDAPLGGERSLPPVAAGELVVISGGARGVTAEVAVALAAACRPTLLLLGRTPAPAAEAAWLQGLSAEGEIKKALLTQAAAPLKPREVEEQYRRILADREIRSTFRRIEEAGGTPLYRAVDLREAAAVAAVLAEARASHGPVRGVIHGAGVLADRRIEDKTADQFAEVYATKIAGLRALLSAVGDDQLKFLALFSSSTGRFGRIGQIDYAVANEVLNKLAQQEAQRRPACRVLSLNWGPWDGGMVTPALKKLFASEGVEIIDLAAGADYLLRELAGAPGGPVELVIHGARAEAQSDAQAETSQPAANICISKAFDLELTVEQYPFLRSHVIDKKAVLPMAMMVEWMAHGAIHNNPGLRFHGFNDLRLLKGVTLLEEHRHTLQVMTGKAFKSGDFHVVPVELSGVNERGQQFVHARAKIVLATRLPEARAAAGSAELSPYPLAVAEIYRPERLFHGPDFHGIRQVLGCAEEGIAARVQPAPLPAQWIGQPLRNAWLADPLALDSSFQMMILWSFERYQAASLPVFAGRYRQYREAFPDAGSEIRIRVTRQQQSKATADIDFVDAESGQLIARIEDYECVIDASLNQSFQRNKLQGAA